MITTVGPYQQYGMPLVEACARSGTYYADLTGEVLFMRQTADRWHETAEGSAARIVHACGFDSILSDLGVLLLPRGRSGGRRRGAGRHHARGDLGQGGLSGGTFASLKGTLDEARGSPEARRLLADPYALSPDRSAEPNLARARPAGHRARRGSGSGWPPS